MLISFLKNGASVRRLYLYALLKRCSFLVWAKSGRPDVGWMTPTFHFRVKENYVKLVAQLQQKVAKPDIGPAALARNTRALQMAEMHCGVFELAEKVGQAAFFFQALIIVCLQSVFCLPSMIYLLFLPQTIFHFFFRQTTSSLAVCRVRVLWP